MSIEYPCVYFYGNGMCSYGGDRSEANICVFGPCENETPSNGDMIRRMSDEELAKWICSHMTYMCCERKCPGREICEPEDNGLVKWMKQPAEDRRKKNRR